jgi:hypothetical protein
MLNFRQLLAAFSLLAGLATVPAHAETFHTCGTIINSLPAVITTQGVYCLTHDLTTAITSGNAIDIQANNVTIDCNSYKIGGLAAGASSVAAGIAAGTARQNITVRNCGIRGFYFGISLSAGGPGGAGHLVEDNRLDNNLSTGILVGGDNNLVQRNRVYDTGGYTLGSISTGINADADVIDNTVSGVFAVVGNTNTNGISMNGLGNEARGNRVRGLAVAGTGSAIGIESEAAGQTIDGNRIYSSVSGTGIYGNGATNTVCSGNNVLKFSTPISNCQDGGGNVTN